MIKDISDGGGSGPERRPNRMKKDAAEDRLPPNSPEAEVGVLSCVLQEPLRCMGECEESAVDPVWFYDLRHAMIYKAMREMHAESKSIDVITLHQRLKDAQLLEQVGGLAYVSALPDLGGSPFNNSHYIEIVREKWILRRLIRACTCAVEDVYDHTGELEALLERVARDVCKIAEERVDENEQAVKDVVVTVIGELEDYHRGRAQMRGLATGLEYLDKMLCGIGGKNGNYIVISARPGIGKTALAMDIAQHAACDFEHFEAVMENGRVVTEIVDGVERVKGQKKTGIPVGVFSLEMSAEALVQRMMFQRARADIQRWRTGFALVEDFEPLTKSASDIAKAKIWIDDEGRCTIETLKAKARRWHREHGIKLFIIDYIQLMRVGAKRFRDDRVQELAEISGEIQNLGKELNVPFIVLAQMNRDYEKDPNRPPRLSDLKDCGSIEQDADVVGFLYAPKMKEKAAEIYDNAMLQKFGKDWSKYPWRINMEIAKNRHGPTGKVEMLFQKSCTHFMDYNLWLKDNGFMALAAGESKPKGEPTINDEQDI